MKKSMLLTLPCVAALACPIAAYAVCGTITGAGTPPGPGFNDYLAGTKPCSVGTVGGTSSVCSDLGGTEATFTPALSVRQVPFGWSTWSSPPFSETSTPIVGALISSAATSLTITLNGIAAVLGVEIEPDNFVTVPISATYYDQFHTPLFSITQNVNGSAGARLFAGVCTTEGIHSVTITAPASAGGFAIAKPRSEQFAGGVPDPPNTSTPSTAVSVGQTQNAK